MDKIDFKKTPGGRRELAFSPNNRWVAQGDDQGSVTIWDLESGDHFPLTPDGRPAHNGPIVSLAFAAANPITGVCEAMVTAGEENTVKLWSVVERLGIELKRGSLALRP